MVMINNEKEFLILLSMLLFAYLGLFMVSVYDKIKLLKSCKKSYLPDKSFLLVEDYTKEGYCPTSKFECGKYLDDISFIIEERE